MGVLIRAVYWLDYLSCDVRILSALVGGVSALDVHVHRAVWVHMGIVHVNSHSGLAQHSRRHGCGSAQRFAVSRTVVGGRAAARMASALYQFFRCLLGHSVWPMAVNVCVGVGVGVCVDCCCPGVIV